MMTQKCLIPFLGFPREDTHASQQLSLLTVLRNDYLLVEAEHHKGRRLVILTQSRLRRGRAGLAISGTEAGQACQSV